MVFGRKDDGIWVSQDEHWRLRNEGGAEVQAKVRQERAAAAKALEASQAEAAALRVEIAARNRDLEEAERVIAEATNVRDAAQKEALALVAKGSAEAAKAKATAEAEAARHAERASRAEAAAKDLADKLEGLSRRHGEALEDLGHLRSCTHPEAVSVYARPTTGDGKRTYRRVGECCTRCRYVQGFDLADAADTEPS